MKYSFGFLLFLFFLNNCIAQSSEKIIIAEEDPNRLYLNDGYNFTLHYLKYLPKGEVKGALVILPAGGELTENVLPQIGLDEAALEKGMMVIVPSINWGTEDRGPEVSMLNEIFTAAIQEHKVPKDKFFLGGLSNGGMIALRYAEIAVETPEQTTIRPAGVFALDCPLDKIHFYEYCEREIARNFSEAGVGEAKWIMSEFDRYYGGSPEKYREDYIANSVYTYSEKDGGNAQFLKDIPVRFYTDLDTDFLLNQRHRDLYDWNGTDIVALVNHLRLMGNDNAEVIITMGKGLRPDGTRHPHSWSILQTADCLDWMLELF